MEGFLLMLLLLKKKYLKKLKWKFLIFLEILKM